MKKPYDLNPPREISAVWGIVAPVEKGRQVPLKFETFILPTAKVRKNIRIYENSTISKKLGGRGFHASPSTLPLSAVL